jgi:hypothetical protein
VFRHIPFPVREQLLRVRQVTGVGRGLRANVPKLELNARKLLRLLKTIA